MQTVNVTIKAGALKGIVDLPNFDDEQLVNVTVSPEVNEDKKITEQDFEDLLAEIKSFWANHEKPENKTREDYRMERLEAKYGAVS